MGWSHRDTVWHNLAVHPVLVKIAHFHHMVHNDHLHVLLGGDLARIILAPTREVLHQSAHVQAQFKKLSAQLP